MIVVFIIDDLLMAPARSLMFIFKEITRQVEEEFYDETRILKELRLYQERLELGEISVAEYDLVEEKLMSRLYASRERNDPGAEEV